MRDAARVEDRPVARLGRAHPGQRPVVDLRRVGEALPGAQHGAQRDQRLDPVRPLGGHRLERLDRLVGLVQQVEVLGDAHARRPVERRGARNPGVERVCVLSPSVAVEDVGDQQHSHRHVGLQGQRHPAIDQGRGLVVLLAQRAGDVEQRLGQAGGRRRDKARRRRAAAADALQRRTDRRRIACICLEAGVEGACLVAPPDALVVAARRLDQAGRGAAFDLQRLLVVVLGQLRPAGVIVDQGRVILVERPEAVDLEDRPQRIERRRRTVLPGVDPGLDERQNDAVDGGERLALELALGSGEVAALHVGQRDDHRRLRVAGRDTQGAPRDRHRLVELAGCDQEGLGAHQHVVVVGAFVQRGEHEARGRGVVALALGLAGGEEIAGLGGKRRAGLSGGRASAVAGAGGERESRRQGERRSPPKPDKTRT